MIGVVAVVAVGVIVGAGVGAAAGAAGLWSLATLKATAKYGVAGAGGYLVGSNVDNLKIPENKYCSMDCKSSHEQHQHTMCKFEVLNHLL